MIKMNRYWLFQENKYETLGGLDDLKYTFKSIKKAKEYENNNPWRDLSYIIDSKTWKLICRRQPNLPWEEINECCSYDVGEPLKIK